MSRLVVPSGSSLSRRDLLRYAGAGAALVAAAPLLSACGSDSSSSSSGSASPSGTGGSAPTGATITLGSNASDDVPKKAYQAMWDAYAKKSGNTVKVNTVDHNTFQEQINTYLQGSPDQVFTWFAGYRARFFAAQGLAQPIDDVWATIGGDFDEAFKKASTGDDGKQYFVPLYYYPWALFYRKSVFKENGLDPEKITTLDELKAACATFQKKGLVPIAFGDKDGWPAMGTFDYLNVRTNGYDFHVSLMAGKESWTDAKVKQVFTTWAELLPFHQSGALGRTWQDAAGTLLQKKAGMYLLGMFVGQQFPEGADRDDLDFFAFPEINPTYGRETVEAPIDGFMMSKDDSNNDAAKNLLEFIGSPEAENIYLSYDPNNVAASKNADTSKYNALQKKAAELVGQAKSITQFLDRDTRPDFASTVMIPSLQKFLGAPKDIDPLLESIEQQKQAIFSS